MPPAIPKCKTLASPIFGVDAVRRAMTLPSGTSSGKVNLVFTVDLKLGNRCLSQRCITRSAVTDFGSTPQSEAWICNW